MELPFDWIIVKPYIKPRDPESVTSPLPPTERVQDIDSVFTIEPESGSLQPGASSTFTLTFAPAFVSVEDIIEPIFIEPIFIEPIFIEPIFIEPIFIEPIFIEPIFIEEM